MNIYTYYTETHKGLFEDYFKRTLPDSLNLVHSQSSQVCESGDYYEEGWLPSMQDKSQVILTAIKENMGSQFIYADSDIQFFGDILPSIKLKLERCDIACQNDVHLPSVAYCAGFMAFNANETTLKIWQAAHDLTDKTDDQRAFNQVVSAQNLHGRVVQPLDQEQFWSPRNLYASLSTLKPQANILMHHANWCIGVSEKIKQLDYVRKTINELS